MRCKISTYPRHLGGTEHHSAVQFNRKYYFRKGQMIGNEKREWASCHEMAPEANTPGGSFLLG
jgi:hypothetical protein